MPDGPIRVVIVGAGFGGLEAAKALRRAPADVIVVSTPALEQLEKAGEVRASSAVAGTSATAAV